MNHGPPGAVDGASGVIHGPSGSSHGASGVQNARKMVKNSQPPPVSQPQGETFAKKGRKCFNAGHEPRAVWVKTMLGQMIPRELTLIVKLAIQKLYPDCAAEVEARLLRASGVERSHRDILMFAFGDNDRLETLCSACEVDDRNVWGMEYSPEDHLKIAHIKQRDEAKAEIARRREFLGFTVQTISPVG
jgi:hypothetical protein